MDRKREQMEHTHTIEQGDRCQSERCQHSQPYGKDHQHDPRDLTPSYDRHDHKEQRLEAKDTPQNKFPDHTPISLMYQC